MLIKTFASIPQQQVRGGKMPVRGYDKHLL